MGHERKYEWEAAARSYVRAAELSASSSPRVFDIYFRVGACYELSCYQTDDTNSFVRQLGLATSLYRELEQKLADEPNSIRRRIAQAHLILLESMQDMGLPERLKLLDRALELHGSVVTELEESGGEAWQRAALFQLQLVRDRVGPDAGVGLDAALSRVLDLAQRLVSAASASGNTDILGEAYANLMLLGRAAYLCLEDWHSNIDRLAQTVVDALAVAPTINDKRALAFLRVEVAASLNTILTDEMEEQATLALEAARDVGDRPLMGDALSVLMQAYRWRLFSDRDEEKAKDRLVKITGWLEEAKRSLGHFPNGFSRFYLALVYAEAVNGHYLYARHFLAEKGEKKEFLDRGLEIFRDGEHVMKGTNSLTTIHLALGGAEVLHNLALIEDDRGKRIRLLNEAVSISESLALWKKIYPLFHWYIGVWYNLQGSLYYLLAQMETADVGDRKSVV
jgi:hypothetical protein